MLDLEEAWRAGHDPLPLSRTPAEPSVLPSARSRGAQDVECLVILDIEGTHMCTHTPRTRARALTRTHTKARTHAHKHAHKARGVLLHWPLCASSGGAMYTQNLYPAEEQAEAAQAGQQALRGEFQCATRAIRPSLSIPGDELLFEEVGIKNTSTCEYGMIVFRQLKNAYMHLGLQGRGFGISQSHALLRAGAC